MSGDSAERGGRSSAFVANVIGLHIADVKHEGPLLRVEWTGLTHYSTPGNRRSRPGRGVGSKPRGTLAGRWGGERILRSSPNLNARSHRFEKQRAEHPSICRACPLVTNHKKERPITRLLNTASLAILGTAAIVVCVLAS